MIPPTDRVSVDVEALTYRDSHKQSRILRETDIGSSDFFAIRGMLEKSAHAGQPCDHQAAFDRSKWSIKRREYGFVKTKP
jgi:hypothetical protein